MSTEAAPTYLQALYLKPKSTTKNKAATKAALFNNLEQSNYSSSIIDWLIPTVLKPPST